jgi:hypothetical protein
MLSVHIPWWLGLIPKMTPPSFSPSSLCSFSNFHFACSCSALVSTSYVDVFLPAPMCLQLGTSSHTSLEGAPLCAEYEMAWWHFTECGKEGRVPAHEWQEYMTCVPPLHLPGCENAACKTDELTPWIVMSMWAMSWPCAAQLRCSLLSLHIVALQYICSICEE